MTGMYEVLKGIVEGIEERIHEFSLPVVEVPIGKIRTVAEEQNLIVFEVLLGDGEEVEYGEIEGSYVIITLTEIGVEATRISRRHDTTIPLTLLFCLHAPTDTEMSRRDMELWRLRVIGAVYDNMISSDSKMKLDNSTTLTFLNKFTLGSIDGMKCWFSFDCQAIKHIVG